MSRSVERHETRSNTNNTTYDRHSETRVAPQFDRGSSRSFDRGFDRGRSQSDSNRYSNRSVTQADSYRNADRGRTQFESNRSFDSNRSSDRGRYQSEAYRNGGNRSGGYDRSGSRGNYSRGSFDSRGRESMRIEGRINRFNHERGGYRVWVDGGRFPLWIPEARIGFFPRLRVGLSLRVGGYYDPLGYVEAYDYYDGAYGVGAYNAGVYSSSGVLRGVVETIDYRRGTLVLRDDATGNIVTAVIRDRQLESLRPGDFAEISGDWTRAGVFEALSLVNVDGERY